MESLTSIEQFQEDLHGWKQELSSIKQEICHFEQHLENLAKEKLPRQQLASIEHFQNTFICQKEEIDKLRHDLPDSQKKVESTYNILQTPVDNPKHQLAERMDTFRKIYEEIKQDFKKFRSSLSLQFSDI